MPDYKTRNSFMTYQVYLKKRETTCHYNKGLYWIDPSGGKAVANTPPDYWKTNAIRSFQKAICADPHNEDAKYQLQILMTTPPKVDISNCLLDCSGCQWVNSQKS